MRRKGLLPACPQIPLLAKEGWLRDQEDDAKVPLSAQTGWSEMTENPHSETYYRNRPPRPLLKWMLRDIF